MRIYQNLLEFVEAISKGQWYTPFSHNWTLVMAPLSPVLLRVSGLAAALAMHSASSDMGASVLYYYVSLAGTLQRGQTETSGFPTDPWGLGTSCSIPFSS